MVSNGFKQKPVHFDTLEIGDKFIEDNYKNDDVYQKTEVTVGVGPSISNAIIVRTNAPVRFQPYEFVIKLPYPLDKLF